MELKLKCPFGATSLQARSNRTFMELKYSFLVNSIIGKWCSNRTFMELKWVNTNLYCKGVWF